MPTGPWTVPTPLTTPELATTTTAANPAATTTVTATTSSPLIPSTTAVALAAVAAASPLLLLWPLPARVDPYAIYIAASIKLIEISARRSLAVDVTVVKREPLSGRRVSCEVALFCSGSLF